MKFLVDAQLPRRFCDWLRQRGHDALHTLDLEGQSNTRFRYYPYCRQGWSNCCDKG
ncbi:MAG: DUF5615 family PIN-like protein [Pelodictyon phaeoclathratiforme]|nr:DUF5615 family PIN-like protein [Pelodictyon phaeoclathratiforme]